MTFLFQNNSCCGITELIGIRGTDPEKFFRQYRQKDGTWVGDLDAAHILFTDTQEPHKKGDAPFKHGNMFCEYIRKMGLGTVQETAGELNPNSGNQVKAWLWTPIPELRAAYSPYF